MPQGLARLAQPKITYQGQDVSAAWVAKLKHLTWKRSVGQNKRADTISIVLADPDGTFRRTYNVIAKQQIQLQVESFNWNYPGEHRMSDATQMEITRIEIHMNKQGGSELHIEASSIPPSSGFRLTKKSRTAVKTDLKTITEQIAKDHGWKLQYNASENPQVGYAVQHDQSDAAWLERFCHERDLTYKPKNGTLTIMGNQDMEAKAVVGTIVAPTPGNPGGINGRGIISVRLHEDVEDTYAHSVVTSKDVQTGKITTGQADAPDPKGPVLTSPEKPLTGPAVPWVKGETYEVSR
jgi:phage protein D